MRAKSVFSIVAVAALVSTTSGCADDETEGDAGGPLPGTPDDCQPACNNLYDCGYCTVMATSFCYQRNQCIMNCGASPAGAVCIREVSDCSLAAFQQCGWNIAGPGPGG